MKVDLDRPDLVTLATVIAHSQIVVAARSRRRAGSLPADFEAVDRDILDWIAAECRLASRRLRLM
jgi:hypothetical protein